MVVATIVVFRDGDFGAGVKVVDVALDAWQ
jgi:hypothetical protein